ncbi:1,4-alpha-glucan branching protein GlgB [Roseateles sp. L2-2]|uniref:1,4-alpha-glucan branching protein GlgB n=1 Tax=Roseateles sp. L2-2 TaxID=3422597 RepID=UPI003D363FE6
MTTLLPDADLALLARGGHPRPWLWLGAHPVVLAGESGVRFAVWAPHASRVAVVGDFNGWSGAAHPMRRRDEHDAGIWEVFVPGASRGQFYKYEVTGPDGTVLPLKADPYAFRAQLRPDNASIVEGLPAAHPLPRDRASLNRRDAPISVYEVHAMSWRSAAPGEGAHGHGGDAGDGDHADAKPDWDFLARELPPYAAGLGFTHVELMPITEFPFDGSWGYQTLGLHAPTARLGAPDGLHRFVDACHAAGLGVLLDFVPAHFPEDPHGLAKFDGTPLYEYADPREGWHRDWHTLIYDFGKPQVQQFLCGAALFWAERYGIDGLRVDAVASMLYRDYSRPPGEWIPNIHGGTENLEAIALFKRLNEVLGCEAPGVITIAEESTAFPLVSAPTSVGGLGFHYKWNMGWMNDTLHYMREQPIHRSWHHEKMSFGLVYAFSENFQLPLSHDEVVHGKGSLLRKMPGGSDDGGDAALHRDWQQFAHLRAYFGFMWAHPGKKLLFMGQEFAQRDEWNFERALPWDLLDDPRHAGVQRLIGDLNRLYRDRPALHRLDGERDGFEWLVKDDLQHSVLAWVRRGGEGEGRGSVVAVSHFTPITRAGYRLPLPHGGPWRVVLNTDAAIYGGSDAVVDGTVGAQHPSDAFTAPDDDPAITLTLPPLATIFLVPA